MRNDDLALWELSEIADAIADRRITSVEATEACLARIEIWQPRVNAFLRIYKEKALAQAQARWTPSSPPASGAGRCTACRWRTRTCTTARASSRPAAARSAATGVAPVTATVLEKLDAAGVVELGFLNMAEFAAGPTGHNVHHGHCRNPWDQTRVTGGSSSGSGASVARAHGLSARWAPTPAARSACPPRPAAWSA